ncbi:MAG: cytochrome b, partial [Alphaproteobacteria bacterium]|nr:cytochrome b [Alphaproteobacteria bacterium]
SIPDKLGGVIAMIGSICILFVLPWLDRHPVRSGRYRPWFKIAFIPFLVNMFVLGYVGAMPAEGIYLAIGQFATLYYFMHFLVLIPLFNKYEPVLPLPAGI